MIDRKKLKPAKGLKVRHPNDFRHMKEGGESVPMNTYWRRLLKAGDVVECKDASGSQAPTKKKKKDGEA